MLAGRWRPCARAVPDRRAKNMKTTPRMRINNSWLCGDLGAVNQPIETTANFITRPCAALPAPPISLSTMPMKPVACACRAHALIVLSAGGIGGMAAMCHVSWRVSKPACAHLAGNENYVVVNKWRLTTSRVARPGSNIVASSWRVNPLA